MSELKVTKDLENKKLITEYLAAGPKDKVWAAYTQKDMFEKWWGPEGWVTTAKEFNFAPGGRVHYGMKCIDENQGEWFNQTSWGLMEIKAVEEGKSFTYGDFFSDEAGNVNKDMPVITVTNEFIEDGNKTRIISTLLADSVDQIEQLINMGMTEGFSSQLKKLDILVG